MARLDARLEVRLDRQTYERLERRAAAGDLSVAQLVRKAIARELASEEHSWREGVLERGLNLDVPVPQDPAELVRGLEARYETPVAEVSGPPPIAPVATEPTGVTLTGAAAVGQSPRLPRAARPNHRD